MTQFPTHGLFQRLSSGAAVADNVRITGEVHLGQDTNLWFGVVVRGDDAPITIGARTNIQDLTMVHADPDVPNVIGEEVTVGHGCVLHGAQVGDRCLIGMKAVLLGGSVIGAESLVAAGAVVKENFVVPPRSLVAGVPARVIRPITDAEVAAFRASAAGYVKKIALYLPSPSGASRDDF